jgi:2-hydroxy-3-oxopropionate reductase
MAGVGFIGLGIMGAPMASNLAGAGFAVTAFSRTPSSVARLADRGVTAATSVAEVARQCDVVITMLPDSPDVESVALGDDGVFAHAAPGTLYIDMSTIRPDVAARVARHGESLGIDVLDAPVSGGEAGAVEGSLSIMVGGSADAFERATPYFEAMGRTVVHVGASPGSGQTVKAANQLIVAANIQGLAEAVVFLESHGVEMGPAILVLGGGLAGSTVMQRKSTNMLDRSFTPGFRLDLFHKDLGIVQAAARDKGVTLLLGSLVAQVVGSLVARGDGGLDHSAMIQIVDSLSMVGQRNVE